MPKRYVMYLTPPPRRAAGQGIDSPRRNLPPRSVRLGGHHRGCAMPLKDQFQTLIDAGNTADSAFVAFVTVVLIVLSLAMIAAVRRRDP